MLRWNDENRAGKGDFKPWSAFKHPTLGEVEIGGFNPKFYAQNPPPDMLEPWARNEAMFNLYLAQQLPQVRIVSADGRSTAKGVYQIDLTVTNDGKMPTALDIAKRVKMVRAGHVHHHAGKRAGAPGARRRRGASAGGDRDRLVEAGGDEERDVAGEGGRQDQGRRGLDARRPGFEGNRTEMSYAFFFRICSSRPPSAYFT